MSYEAGQTLYRATAGYFDDYIFYEEYEVIKVTPKGAWIKAKWWNSRENRKKFITNWTHFVCRTKVEADASLKIRTKRYIEHTMRRLVEAHNRAQNLGVATPKSLDSFCAAYKLGML